MSIKGKMEEMETKIYLKHETQYTHFLKRFRRLQLDYIVRHICVVLTLTAFILAVTYMNVYRWAPELENIDQRANFVFYVIALAPYLSIPLVILNCVGLLLYNPFFKSTVHLNISSAPFLCFRIVTRGDMPEFVIQNTIYNRDLCLKFGLQQFIIEIVSDKPINCQDKERVREIIVPKTYRTHNGSLYKARALNYCLESHVNLLAGNDWIVHLDEETLLTGASLSGILHFVTNGKGDIGQGPISYANGEIIENWITTLADSVRLSIDYALFRFQFAFLNRPVIGFKGSYIVVRNNVEMEIGLDNGPYGSIAEDCFFALKAWSKGYKFGFITGEMCEISPFTLKDFIRQRRRWFVGQMYVVLSKEISMVYKLGICFSLLGCILLPISLSNVLIDIVCPVQRSFLLCCLNGLVGGTFSFLYCFGTFISCTRRNWSVFKLIVVSVFSCVFIIPIAAAMESIAVYWGLFTLKSNDFFIVQKESHKANKHGGNIKIV